MLLKNALTFYPLFIWNLSMDKVSYRHYLNILNDSSVYFLWTRLPNDDFGF